MPPPSAPLPPQVWVERRELRLRLEREDRAREEAEACTFSPRSTPASSTVSAVPAHEPSAPFSLGVEDFIARQHFARAVREQATLPPTPKPWTGRPTVPRAFQFNTHTRGEIRALQRPVAADGRLSSLCAADPLSRADVNSLNARRAMGADGLARGKPPTPTAAWGAGAEAASALTPSEPTLESPPPHLALPDGFSFATPRVQLRDPPAEPCSRSLTVTVAQVD